MLKRVEPWGFLYSVEYVSPWFEPGEAVAKLSVPPNVYPKNLKGGSWISKFSHLRAPLCPEQLKKPPRKWPTGLEPWQELDLALRWREDFDHVALTALIESYRPMVVNMAQRYVGANRKVIIEYGVFGLRMAVSARGYDPNGSRLGGEYARDRVRRFMRAAANAMGGVITVKGRGHVVEADGRGSFYEELRPLEDGVEKFREWAETPIPPENERAEPGPEHYLIADLIEEIAPAPESYEAYLKRREGIWPIVRKASSSPPEIEQAHGGRWIDELIEETAPRVRTFDFDSLAVKRRGKSGYYVLDQSASKFNRCGGRAWHRYQPCRTPQRRSGTAASPDTRQAPLRIRAMFKRDCFSGPVNSSRATYSRARAGC